MIHVDFSVFATRYHIEKALIALARHEILSFDTETKGVYTKQERAEAIKLLKEQNLPVETKQIALLVANNSGLSFPTLLSVTHFVFGTSENHSVLLICDNPQLEYHIWDWISKYNGKFLIHNTLFDLKIMYNRIQCLPQNYEDTALLSKALLNHANTWKSKVGLKELMSSYYDPAWSLFEEYEPDNFKEPTFLAYAAIDGAATFKLWADMQIHLLGDVWTPPEEQEFRIHE